MSPAVAVAALALAQLPADRVAKWEKEVAAIEKRLTEYPPTPGGVVFAGSSSVRLWDLKKSFPDAGYVNVGFGGSEIRDCTHFADRLITRHRPRAVVFYAGDNDLNSKRTPEQVRDDFKTFVAAVPDARILFVAVKPSPKRWAIFGQQKEANRLVKVVCDADPRLTFVDVVPAMLGPDGKPKPELYVKDELHLSPAGYKVWAPLVRAALK
ncbi:MAG: GDSL-type esterase/lipase family protein [Gemmataceae bacterium]